MKPLNIDNQSCGTTLSSNCIIWQGNDIKCLKLCKGDTISNVVYKLAKEVCDIMETFDVTNYDLSCFNLTTCSPADFQALIQLLIKRICLLETCTDCAPDCNGNSVPSIVVPGGSGCPDCMVPIAPCFHFPNPFGDMVTEMQLLDYVTAIGNRLCVLIDQYNTLQAAIVDLNNRVIALENAPVPTLSLPSFIPTSVLPPVMASLMVITQALEPQFGVLRNATGTPDQIYTSLTKQPDALNTAKVLGPIGGNMSSITGWVNNPSNLAATITNLWLTIGDLRAAVGTIKLAGPKGCEDVTIRLQLSFIGSTLKLFFTGTLPVGFKSCDPSGTMFTITDTSGGLINQFINVATNINDINGVSLALSGSPLNLLNNLTVVGTPCFHNSVTNATCQSALQETFYNTLTCPNLLLVPAFTNFTYSAATLPGIVTYTVQVYDVTGVVLITSVTSTEVGPGILSGSIGGLVGGTSYKVRLALTIGGVPTNCAFQSVTLFAIPVIPPVIPPAP